LQENEIREVIKLEEIQQEEQREDEKPVTEEEIENRLQELRGKVPSFVIRDLRENLSGKQLTKGKLEKIINRVVSSYFSSRGSSQNFSKYVADMNKKLDDLAKEIRDLKQSREKLHETEKIPPAEKAELDKYMETQELESQPPERVLFSMQEQGGARLERLPEDVLSIMLAMKWVEFLVEKVGITNLPDVLEFYVELGWISDEVFTKLIKYARGTKPFHEEVDWKPEEKLTARDHMLSLLFIERLRGRRISRDLLILLDREINKIKSSAEEIYGV